MRRTNTVPPPGVKNDPQATTGNDGAPKGRYKSGILPPGHGMPTSNSKLSSGYLRSFGFANTRSSLQPETSNSEPIEDSTQQLAAGSDDQDLWSLDGCLPPPPTSAPPPPPPPQEGNAKGEIYPVLSESQLNVMSFSLSEIADRISPTIYDPQTEIGEESLDTLMDGDVGTSSEAIIPSNDEQPTRFKTPYSRQRRGSKTFVSKQKSFTRKRYCVHHGSQHELNNNGEISFDASNILSLPAGNSEAFKQDNESDSGYSSSMSASISLSEEVEASKRLSFENGSGTDIEADDLTGGGDDHVIKISADNPVTNESIAGGSSHQNEGNVEEGLESLIQGVSSGVSGLSFNGNWVSETDVHSQRGAAVNGVDDPSTSFKSSHKNSTTFEENTNRVSDNFTKSPLQKASLDDTFMPSKHSKKRPGLFRRRTTLVSFRPPKQMTVQEGESDIVEMDEAGFLQMLTDLKSFKTQLLKLKRELQEADVVSPLMHSHSWATRRGSLSTETDLLERNSLHKKKMTFHRTMTMDAAAIHHRLHRTSSSPSTGGLVANLNDIIEQTETSTLSNKMPKSAAGDNEEMKNLRKELEEVKEKLITMTEERNSLMIAREELEHELDSKIHTIRMLQKQLESQTDSQDEMAYLKRQVKSLTSQIQQQQQKITELRFRTSSPGPGPIGVISKETVKADIRNRLRDAFVKHLGESSKSNIQLSKFIQKAEQSISMAQKDKSRPSLQRSESQSSAERGQEDSDEKDSESDSSKCTRRKVASSDVNRSNEDSDSESGKSVRRRTASPNTSRSEDEADIRRASDSDSGKSRRQRVASPPFDSNNEDVNKTNLERDSAKVVMQAEVTDTYKLRKPSATTPRIRKLSRSKLLTKIEASPLSQSWTPGAIEKIVKSWRETKSPAASREKTVEEEKPALKPVSHVQFL